jgi:hypothetical protein
VKIRLVGFTVISTPFGDLMVALYILDPGPTFVTFFEWLNNFIDKRNSIRNAKAIQQENKQKEQREKIVQPKQKQGT